MKFTLLSCLLAISIFSFSQNYSKVRIWTSTNQLTTLNSLGLALDDVQFKENTFIEGDFSSEQIQRVKNAGFTVDVLIEDVKAYYVERSTEPAPKNLNCTTNSSNPIDDIETPSNFHLGSYAGYYTYNELLTELDEMYGLYPNLISQKQGVPAVPVDTTLEGRELMMVKISDNPNIDENEPEVLYTSIHHAREPGSLIQNVYYMWYLLENYGTDPEVTYLVDNTQMYFIPVINPDGYVYNETTDPNGGGMHRKNRRDVGSFNKGVDLNRNYSYQWGTTGVDLNDFNSDVYPGTNAFSENETQIVKWFIENHDILYASNAHTHGDLLLFPIGTTTQEFAIDHDYFQNYTDYMARYNKYVAQKSSGLYPASGDSDDYMYKFEDVYAITPEIGNGFWPPMSAIIPMCKEMIHPNLTLSHLAHKFGVVEDLELFAVNTMSGYFNYNFLRLGYEDGAIDVSVTPLDGIQTMGQSNTHDISLNALEEDSVSFTLASNIQTGDMIRFVYEQDFGGFIKRDTIIKQYGEPSIIAQDNLDNADDWTGTWSLTTNEFYSPSTSMTDSPGGNYQNNENAVTVYDQDVDLTDAIRAKVSFYAKWNIEANYDYVQFEVSTNNGVTWIPQCGLHTNAGENNNSIQPVGEPLYDGVQSDWVKEEINLSDYFGEIVKLRFVLRSDNFVEEDGFYFDDFTVYVDELVATDEVVKPSFKLFPNPAKNQLTVALSQTINQADLKIFSVDGKSVVNTSFSQTNKVEVNVEDLISGVYIVEIKTENGIVLTERSIKK